MSTVDVNIKEAMVTSIRKFNTSKGPGVDYSILASSEVGDVYLQVTLYDNMALCNYGYIHEGDRVTVAGFLKDKPYIKSDGTAGHSLVIEKPTNFAKLASNSQLTQETSSDTHNMSGKNSLDGSSGYSSYSDNDEINDFLY